VGGVLIWENDVTSLPSSRIDLMGVGMLEIVWFGARWMSGLSPEHMRSYGEGISSCTVPTINQNDVVVVVILILC